MPVTIDTSLPLHDDRDAAWDGDAATAAMLAACADDSGDTFDPECMGKGFLYRDGDADPATVGAYKFPVANVFDGDKQIVYSGVTAAAGRLESAKGISDDDLASMRTKLSELYKKFADKFGDESIVAPWDDAPDAETASGAAEPDAPSDGSGPNLTAPDGAALRLANADDSGCGCDGCGCRPGADDDTAPPEYDPVIRASASDGKPWSPKREWFAAQDPSPLTITPDGQVYGDLARFGQRHIGADGHDIYPPKDPDGLYRSFRQRTITCDNGDKIAVGVLTMDTGHAGMGIGAQAAVEHYDHTGAIVAAVNVGEDDQGGGRIWLAGALLPDVTDEQKLRLMLSGVSGDWRQTRSRGPLELVAALAVNVPGFPVPAVEVADGRELTMVAAGAVLPTAPAPVHSIELSDEVVDRVARRCVEVAEETAAARERDRVAAARLAKAQVAAGVMRGCVRRARARKAHNQLTAAVARRMMADGDDDEAHGALVAQGRRNRFLDAQGRNWVEQTGGLPRTIRRIADHLIAKGFDESHAIATAVNVVKKWCWGAPDGLNWPGVQKVKPQTRSRGCVAVAEWNLNRARARAT